MKNFILSTLILFSFQVFAQEVEIPKKAWKIIVHTSLNKADNYKSVGQFLIDNNCTIDKNNVDFGTLSTGPVPVKKSSIVNYYNIVCKDSAIVFSGLMNANMSFEMYGVKSESSLEKIENKGMMGSLYKKSFNAMNELAIKIPNTKIEYVIE